MWIPLGQRAEIGQNNMVYIIERPQTHKTTLMQPCAYIYILWYMNQNKLKNKKNVFRQHR